MDTNIRSEVVFAAIQRARASTDRNSPLRHEYTFIKIYNDESLTKYEKSYALIMIERDYDFCKVTQNKGEKRLCEHCSLESLATTYCENCIRIYLINNFPNWTSGNDNVDYLIQACQKEAARPDNIIEWIPYNKLQNIKYLAEGGISKIYSATWTDGRYDWNLETQQLIRIGELKVVLKKLENVENADRRWFDEAIIHLTLCNKNGELVICYGLTKDPKDGKYMIVMRRMNTDLRKYLRENRPSWKEKLIIANDIIKALCSIHGDGAIHRDLHSGNILYSEFNNHWYISDLGFCGPADKPLNGIYGNLPYIAPEVLTGGGYTSASDIYSFGMLMWEISSERVPFNKDEHDYYLMGEICKGQRPEIITGIPSEYKELMQRCWDSDPHKRPDANAISDVIEKMRDDSYKNDDTNELNTLEQEEQDNSSQIPGSSSKSTSSNSSKIYEPYEKPAVSTAEQEECLV